MRAIPSSGSPKVTNPQPSVAVAVSTTGCSAASATISRTSRWNGWSSRWYPGAAAARGTDRERARVLPGAVVTQAAPSLGPALQIVLARPGAGEEGSDGFQLVVARAVRGAGDRQLLRRQVELRCGQGLERLRSGTHEGDEVGLAPGSDASAATDRDRVHTVTRLHEGSPLHGYA
jgi:hypothetical protein